LGEGQKGFMPTYEYSCKSCGEHLEVVQSFKDDALTECPKCGGNLRKVFGNIGIAFKGSGFYRNDSRQGHSSVKPAVPATSSGSETTTGTSGGEASKPAANGAAPEKTNSSPAPAASPAKSTSAPSKAAAAS
jgi:putative FmdB family regulatory protein